MTSKIPTNIIAINKASDGEMLDHIKGKTFEYFRHEWNPLNGLVADKNQPGAPASIAVLGMAFTVYAVGVERGYLSRTEACDRILTALRFLKGSEQSTAPDATGHMGFYYHFLDMKTGKRALQSEISTIDTAILMAGILTARQFFDRDNGAENEIRELADFLYLRVLWPWALNGAATLSHGWTPEGKFIRYRWSTNYSEAMILYTLALGSPTHAINARSYHKWTSTFKTLNIYDIECLHAGPMFIHQMSHLWIDFRNIQDRFNREAGFDYFENSRRATLIQQKYAIKNPKKYEHYGEFVWGLTACDGPGPAVKTLKGVRRVFYDYRARGVPHGPDDGTISPWAVVASLPFAPDICINTIRHMVERLGERGLCKYGFDASYNSAFPQNNGSYQGWISPWIFGLNEGPNVIMIENYQSDFIWRLMQKCPYLITGLKAADFQGGWLALA